MIPSLADRTWNACFSALQLDRFLAGEMTEGEAERLRSHLAGCDRCGDWLGAPTPDQSQSCKGQLPSQP